MIQVDIVVIGGGPAGLSAAISAKKEGADVLLIEREEKLGGILKQCIHDGFGLVRFNEKLSGPEYADRFIEKFHALSCQALLQSFVTKIEKRDEGFTLTVVNREGILQVDTKALVFATGCRERTPRQVGVHGTRPAGIYTAGAAQNYMNLSGLKIGSRCVVLGSGDIGLIMARRMTLEGIEVPCVCEIQPVPSGLPRNVHQCLEDFSIPLLLNTTVTKVFGDRRVEGVEIAKVDEQLKPVPGTEERIDCDTLLVSVGLIPENELQEALGVPMDPKTHGPVLDVNFQTQIPGVFSCGNSFHVYDLVDYVSESGENAGKAAADYVRSGLPKAARQEVVTPVKKAVPPGKLVCIGCPGGCILTVTESEGHLTVSGNGCIRGHDFAVSEYLNPMRVLTTTVRTVFPEMPFLPVRTEKEIPKGLLFEAMKEVSEYTLDRPVKPGDILIDNLLGTGVSLISSGRIKGGICWNP